MKTEVHNKSVPCVPNKKHDNKTNQILHKALYTISIMFVFQFLEEKSYLSYNSIIL